MLIIIERLTRGKEEQDLTKPSDKAPKITHNKDPRQGNSYDVTNIYILSTLIETMKLPPVLGGIQFSN